MFYGYEKPVEMPIPELFDTGLMQAYTQAVKNEYEKGEKRLDDFISKYGDFTSPFAKDVQRWDDLTMGRINNIYNNLVAQGIDPLRSREGQTAIAQAVRQTPIGELNRLKQSAAIGEQYLKNKAELQSRGLFSQEMEDYFLKHPFQDWSTGENGIFDRTSPLQYKDIHQLTDDWFKHLEKKYNDALTKKKNDGYDYYTVDENDINGVIKSNIKDFLDSDYGRYYYNKARRQAQLLNPAATNEQINQIAIDKLYEDVVNRNSDYLKEDRKTNEYKLLDYKNKLDQTNYAMEWAHQERMAAIKGASKLSKGSEAEGNYHQDTLQRGLYAMSGKTDYDKNKNRDDVLKNGKVYLNNTISKIKETEKNPWKRIPKIINATLLKGSAETPAFIAEKLGHTKGKTYGNWIVNGKKVEALTLSNNELVNVIERRNWAAKTVGSGIRSTNIINSLHRQISNLNKETINIKGKMIPRWRWIWIPSNNNNVATTIDKNGAVTQANRGKLYAVNVEDNNDIKSYGETFIPFNVTEPTSTDGDAKLNEYITSPGWRARVNTQENNVRKLQGIKSTNKGSNIEDYDW